MIIPFISQLYDKLTDFATQKVSIIIWFFLCSAILLFAPSNLLQILHLQSIFDVVASVLGLLFVISGVLLLIRLFKLIKIWTEKRKRLQENKSLCTKLEKLYSMPEVKSGFKSQTDCISWSNKVAPLLKFNQEYYTNFVANSHKLNIRGLSGDTVASFFSIMVSQLEMAIQQLKNDTDTEVS